MLRIGSILVLVLCLSGLAGFALETDCAEACDRSEASGEPECQDCFCCVSMRCLLPDSTLTEADRADAPLPLPRFDNHSSAHPREISHVPRLLSR